jgi:hypothetical protein
MKAKEPAPTMWVATTLARVGAIVALGGGLPGAQGKGG